MVYIMRGCAPEKHGLRLFYAVVRCVMYVYFLCGSDDAFKNYGFRTLVLTEYSVCNVPVYVWHIFLDKDSYESWIMLLLNVIIIHVCV